MDKMHPLFGNTWDAKSDEASSDPAECSLIKRVLVQLDPELDASITYALARKFIAFKSTVCSSENSAKPSAAVIERFLNWAFFVRRLSPLKMLSEDIIAFCEFYFSPPVSYLRTARLCKRFVGSGTSLSVNPDWKPFYMPSGQAKNVGRVISILRNFFGHASLSTPVNISLPRGRAGVAPTDSKEALGDDYLVERYFVLLIENTEDSVRRRPSRTSRNKQIFVFATCYLLKVPFAELSRYTRFFSMSSFSVDSNAWQLNLEGDEGLISRKLPGRYIEILRNYRVSCGLSEMPSPCEVEPIFGSRRAIEHVWGSLPVFEFMGTTVGQHLRRLTSSANRSSDSEGFVQDVPDKTAHARRTNKSLRVAAELLNKKELSRAPVRSLHSPPSLFNYHQKNPALIEFVNESLLHFKIQRCVGILSDSDTSTIQIFVRYANSVRGRKNRYKVRGIEKLALWCLLVTGFDIARLTKKNVMEFLTFCSVPPRNWCSNNTKSTGLETGRSSTEWRPFKLLVNETSLILRAVRIIDWCSAVTQDLVDMAVLSYNPFVEISKMLGSSKHH